METFEKKFESLREISVIVSANNLSRWGSNKSENFTVPKVSSVKIEGSMIMLFTESTSVNRLGSAMSKNEYHVGLSASILTGGIDARWRKVDGEEPFCIECRDLESYTYVVTIFSGDRLLASRTFNSDWAM